jgi:hypothetical protein
LAFPKDNFDLDRLRSEGIVGGVAVRVLYLLFGAPFEVEELGQICKHKLHVRLGQSLAETHSLAAAEGQPRELMAALSIRCEGKRTLRVKPLGKKLSWSLPLLGVEVEGWEINGELGPLEELHFVGSEVLCDHVLGRHLGGWTESQGLHVDHVEELQVLDSLEGDELLEEGLLVEVGEAGVILKGLLSGFFELVTHLLKVVLVLDEMSDHRLGRKLGRYRARDEEVEQFVDDELIREDVGVVEEHR